MAKVPKEAVQRSRPWFAFWAVDPPAAPVAVVFAPLSPVDIEDIHPAVIKNRIQAATKIKFVFLFMQILPYKLFV
jgi:hypothetical protein